MRQPPAGEAVEYVTELAVVVVGGGDGSVESEARGAVETETRRWPLLPVLCVLSTTPLLCLRRGSGGNDEPISGAGVSDDARGVAGVWVEDAVVCRVTLVPKDRAPRGRISR